MFFSISICVVMLSSGATACARFAAVAQSPKWLCTLNVTGPIRARIVLEFARASAPATKQGGVLRRQAVLGTLGRPRRPRVWCTKSSCAPCHRRFFMKNIFATWRVRSGQSCIALCPLSQRDALSNILSHYDCLRLPSYKLTILLRVICGVWL